MYQRVLNFFGYLRKFSPVLRARYSLANIFRWKNNKHAKLNLQKRPVTLVHEDLFIGRKCVTERHFKHGLCAQTSP